MNDKKLDAVIILLQHLLAVELSKNGMTHDQIRKHLGVGKATVNSMLKGVKKEN